MPDEVERKGLGTPATRAGVIEKLVRIGFVERQGNKKTKYLVTTDKGTSLITVMPEQIQSAPMTAEWEQKLLEVEKQIQESIDPIEDVGAGPSISRNHMRGIENMVEQNDNSFDGIINNVPAAPVPDFAEINEKADQEDIAADTKASVMEKIKEQQEKVKTAPVPVPERKAPEICPCREM